MNLNDEDPVVHINYDSEDYNYWIRERNQRQRLCTHKAVWGLLVIWTLLSIAWSVSSVYILTQTDRVQFKDEYTAEYFKFGVITLLLFGITMLVFSILGHICQHFHFNPIQNKNCGPTQALRIFLACLAITTFIEAPCLGLLLYVVIYTFISPDSYHSIEHIYSTLFNGYYFASTQGAKDDINPDQFWSWVRDQCPSGLWDNQCLKKETFSIGNCAADSMMCHNQNGFGYACPYIICRDTALRTASTYFTMIIGILFLFFVVHIIILNLGFCTSMESEEIHDNDVEGQTHNEELIARRNSRLAKSATDLYDNVMFREHSFRLPDDDHPTNDSRGPISRVLL